MFSLIDIVGGNNRLITRLVAGIIVSLASLVGIATEVQAGDWPRWRGVAGDGGSTEQGLLDTWPTTGPPIAWRSKGLGAGFASLSIVGDQIFTMGEKQGSSHIVAVGRSDGSAVWSAPFGSGEPNCTPTVDGDLVYGLSRDGELAAVRRKDGKLVWQVSFTKDFGGSVPTWGYSESPLVDGRLLICTPGGKDAFLVALDKTSGDVVWTMSMPAEPERRGHGGAGYSSPIISHAAGTKQYVTLTGNGVIGVAAETGEFLWGYDRIANGTANVPTPIAFDDHILASSGYGDGGTALIRLSKDGDSYQANEVYYFPSNEMQNHHGGMILRDGYVYMGHGQNNGFPVCFSALSGKDAWRPGRGAGRESAAVAYADGHLYFRYQDATMALVEATPDAYKLKGSFKLASHNRESWAHPVVLDGMLYIRDQDELLVYDVREK